MITKSKIKLIKSLQVKKNRDAESVFFVEGVKAVNEVLEQKPELIEELFATAEFIEQNAFLLNNTGVAFSEISEKELIQISSQSTPNKVLAVCRYFKKTDIKFDFEKSFSLYLDDIRDPGNFGTIIRLADWFGISNIFCSNSSCDIYNPKVIQATMGAFLRVNVNYIDLKSLIQQNKINYVYGALLDGKNIYSEKLVNGLIVIGNEAYGISTENMNLINRAITIPGSKNHKSESLNAAMAASIITAEFFRQVSSS